MNSPETASFRLHEDPPWFLEAVNATAAATGFAPRVAVRPTNSRASSAG